MGEDIAQDKRCKRGRIEDMHRLWTFCYFMAKNILLSCCHTERYAYDDGVSGGIASGATGGSSVH